MQKKNLHTFKTRYLNYYYLSFCLTLTAMNMNEIIIKKNKENKNERIDKLGELT